MFQITHLLTFAAMFASNMFYCALIMNRKSSEYYYYYNVLIGHRNHCNQNNNFLHGWKACNGTK